MECTFICLNLWLKTLVSWFLVNRIPRQRILLLKQKLRKHTVCAYLISKWITLPLRYIMASLFWYILIWILFGSYVQIVWRTFTGLSESTLRKTAAGKSPLHISHLIWQIHFWLIFVILVVIFLIVWVCKLDGWYFC